ncbi:NAD(P)-binding protein [Leucogyrophana mollusca]|uniref:NAD(P)-binding protein n=1 Tax=Leucogyrophana mollusca TaxID=85980 RepID=A0ACB8B6S6_9AGAM|nr:NAD(P)-binding protein [Leucogyrophana mollusca]
MSESTFKSFAVVGAGNTIGIPIVHALLSHSVPVVVLTRPSSSKELPAAATIAPVDYFDVGAVSRILKAHKVDVLVSALGFEGFPAQKPLADACKEAGVKLFVPSEFGMPTEGGTDGMLLSKSQTASTAHLRSIGLPSLRLYNGLFQEWIPWVAAVEETGKFIILGKGESPVSFTAISDVAGFLAYVLTTLPPSKLSNVVFRIEGERGSMSDISKLYSKSGKAPVEYVDKFPHTNQIPAAEFREYLQKRFDMGAGSTGWDVVAGKEGDEPAGSANALWEGHRWKSVKETLGL